MDYAGVNRLIVYMDECGDHSLTSIDTNFPVFGLAGVICTPHSASKIAQEAAVLKFKYFGHEGVNLHTREIAKWEGDFSFLADPVVRKSFLDDVSSFVSKADFQLVVSVIDKVKLNQKYTDPVSPYTLSLVFLMEKIFRHACRNEFDYIHYIIETRGKRENQELHEVFDRFRTKGTEFIDRGKLAKIHQRIEYVSKSQNVTGVQVADLVVSPAAKEVFTKQPHPSAKYFERKYLMGKSNGLKVFP